MEILSLKFLRNNPKRQRIGIHLASSEGHDVGTMPKGVLKHLAIFAIAQPEHERYPPLQRQGHHNAHFY
jgi:hypothetical protein